MDFEQVAFYLSVTSAMYGGVQNHGKHADVIFERCIKALPLFHTVFKFLFSHLAGSLILFKDIQKVLIFDSTRIFYFCKTERNIHFHFHAAAKEKECWIRLEKRLAIFIF